MPGTLESLGSIGSYVLAAASAAGLDHRAAYRLRLAVDEIASNIIIHGYQETCTSGDVVVKAEVGDNALTIVLEDTAAPFNPRGRGRPSQIDLAIDERPIGGLGVFLAMRSVDEFRYEYVENRNRNIFIVKRPE